MTYWGGSQFINSEGTGRYEDFVLNELVQAVKSEFSVSNDRRKWCVSGGSSGGYGALHLATRRPDVFGVAAAIAPDSFFEASLLPDLYTALPVLTSIGGIGGVRREIEAGRWMKRKEAFPVLNAIAMGLCYAPTSNGNIEYPLDAETGILKPEVWAKWKRHDPVEFIKERSNSAARLDLVYLDVGTKDQFQLLFGTRQIRDCFHDLRVSCDYSEFEGTHFDIGERRPNFWKWLKQNWS
jgi:enterochelin esterase family protein